MSTDPRVAEFMADHDVKCPACGYSLRDLKKPTCPECGAPLDLRVVRADRPDDSSFPATFILWWTLGMSILQIAVMFWRTMRHRSRWDMSFIEYLRFDGLALVVGWSLVMAAAACISLFCLWACGPRWLRLRLVAMVVLLGESVVIWVYLIGD